MLNCKGCFILCGGGDKIPNIDMYLFLCRKGLSFRDTITSRNGISVGDISPMNMMV